MTNSALHHDDIDRLLPWYANETLEADERQAVDLHLQDCAECQASLSLLLAMNSAVNDPHAVPMIPTPQPATLLSRLDDPDTGETGSAFTRPWLIAATAAAVAVTLIVLLVQRDLPAGDPEFRTVTSDSVSGQVSYVFSLSFSVDITESARSEILSGTGGTIVGVSESGDVRIVIDRPAASLQELEAIRESLLDRKEIEQVDIIAVQLPVQREE